MNVFKDFSKSYITHYIIFKLMLGHVVNILDVVEKFKVDYSTAYRDIKDIDKNFATIDNCYEVVKIAPNTYRLFFNNKIYNGV